MDEGYTGICKEHADTFRSSIETRQERAFERKLNRMSSQTAKISAITRQRDRQIIAETAISRVMHTDEHSLDMDAWTKKLRGDK
jgi:ABC-type uncharacterized transport system ATPase component